MAVSYLLVTPRKLGDVVSPLHSIFFRRKHGCPQNQESSKTPNQTQIDIDIINRYKSILISSLQGIEI